MKEIGVVLFPKIGPAPVEPTVDVCLVLLLKKGFKQVSRWQHVSRQAEILVMFVNTRDQHVTQYL